MHDLKVTLLDLTGLSKEQTHFMLGHLWGEALFNEAVAKALDVAYLAIRNRS